MGIQNLFKKCKFEQINFKEIQEKDGVKIIGVDMYVIFHKFAMDIQIAKQLVENPKAIILEYYELVKNYLNNFIKEGFELYLVYDGNEMKYKITEEDRANKRLGCLIKEDWIGAVEITPYQMHNFQEYLEKYPIIKNGQPIKIPFTVAPFEADAQLAFMYKEGIINAVLTNDSDLIIYGIKNIFMIRQKGIEYYKSNKILIKDEELDEVEFINDINLEKLWLFGYLIGCDYFKGIPKIGIVKAFKIINHLLVVKINDKIDWDLTYERLEKNIDYSKSVKALNEIGKNLKERFDLVRMIYTTQPIIDPRDFKLKYLNGNEILETKRDDFGKVYSEIDISKGLINPITGERF